MELSFNVCGPFYFHVCFLLPCSDESAEPTVSDETVLEVVDETVVVKKKKKSKKIESVAEDGMYTVPT